MDDPLVFMVPVAVCTPAWLVGLRTILEASPGDTPFHIVLHSEGEGDTHLKIGATVTADERLMNRIMAWREGAMS